MLQRYYCFNYCCVWNIKTLKQFTLLPLFFVCHLSDVSGRRHLSSEVYERNSNHEPFFSAETTSTNFGRRDRNLSYGIKDGLVVVAVVVVVIIVAVNTVIVIVVIVIVVVVIDLVDSNHFEKFFKWESARPLLSDKLKGSKIETSL